MRFIDKIGVEVEGVFTNKREGIYDVRHLREIKSDESLRLDRDSDNFAYEIVSDAVKDVKEIYEFLDDLKRYLVDDEINESMGFHIHVSFKKRYLYYLIFSREFVEYFKKRLTDEFHDYKKLMRRFENRFCKFDYDNAYFLRVYSNSRYKAINIINAYKKHKTYEIRIFNSDNVEMLKKYVKFSVNTIDSFLTRANITDVFSKNEIFDNEENSVVNLRANEYLKPVSSIPISLV